MATHDSTLDQLAADVHQLHTLYSALDTAGQAYVRETALALANDADGSILELLERHERGERVATWYMNVTTGDRVRLPEGAPVPRRHFPLLSEVQS